MVAPEFKRGSLLREGQLTLRGLTRKRSDTFNGHLTAGGCGGDAWCSRVRSGGGCGGKVEAGDGGFLFFAGFFAFFGFTFFFLEALKKALFLFGSGGRHFEFVRHAGCTGRGDFRVLFGKGGDDAVGNALPDGDHAVGNDLVDAHVVDRLTVNESEEVFAVAGAGDEVEVLFAAEVELQGESVASGGGGEGVVGGNVFLADFRKDFEDQ